MIRNIHPEGTCFSLHKLTQIIHTHIYTLHTLSPRSPPLLTPLRYASLSYGIVNHDSHVEQTLQARRELENKVPVSGRGV